MLAKKNAGRSVSLAFSHGRKSKTTILHAADAHYFTTFQCLLELTYFGNLTLWKIKLGNTHLTNLEPLKSFKELFSFKTRHSDKGVARMKSHRHIGDHTETMEKWQKCQKNRRLIKAQETLSAHYTPARYEIVVGQDNSLWVASSSTGKGNHCCIFSGVIRDLGYTWTIVFEKYWDRLAPIHVTNHKNVFSPQFPHGLFCPMHQLGHSQYPLGIGLFQLFSQFLCREKRVSRGNHASCL